MITGDSGEVVELNRTRQDITAYTMDEVRTMASWSALAWNEEDAALPEGGNQQAAKRKKRGQSALPKAVISAQLEPTDSY